MEPMRQFERVILLVMDGCGAGAAPDAHLFGDEGPNLGDTLVHVARAAGGLRIPTLRRLGLGNALPLAGAPPELAPIGSFGRLRPRSMGGKDTVTGHWEMMGILVDRPFPTYPGGFPEAILGPLREALGTPVLGNVALSGTEILKTLGEEHLRTGHPIVYTSADSVFQIACHEEVVPIGRLYEICRIARELLRGEHGVQRVIARPFEGAGPGSFRRTERRKDFPLPPPENVIDRLAAAGIGVAGVGVVPELFGGRGFSWSRRTQTNEEHALATLEALDTGARFLFVNFEDFDMLYGHRQDAPGFAAALETFDGWLATLLERLGPQDLLLVTADHGNDPTTPSTDHAREHVPVLVHSKGLPGGRDYRTRETFADLGATVAASLGVAPPPVGRSLID